MILFYLLTLFRLCDSITLIEEAKLAIDSGKYSEALTFYDKAIELNNKNHLAYFLRGSLNEALRRFTHSIRDYTQALEIKPEFHKARINRGLVYTKHGKFESALEDFNYILNGDKSEFINECNEHIIKIREIQDKLKKIEKFNKEGKLDNAIEITNDIIDISPYNIELRKIRISLFEKKNDNDVLVSELTVLSQLVPSDIELALKISNLYYVKGDFEETNNYLQKCLLSDPENTACKVLYRKVKKIKKHMSSLETLMNENKNQKVVEEANNLIKTAEDNNFIIGKARGYLCRAYYKMRKYDESLNECSAAVKIHPNDRELRYTRAEIYIQKDLIDEAKSEYNEILSQYPDDAKSREGLKKIEKILKNKNRRDYYKILDVPKTATKKEIEKAYRKLVKIWHPDHFREEEKIKEANKKLQDLNDARLVLIDEEKRRKFDEGIDPLDPEQNVPDGFGEGGHHQQFHFNQGGGSFFNFFKGGNFFGGGHF